MAAIFAVFAIVFDTFPRPRYSELEKRELATFPPFTLDSLWSGDYAEAVGEWFSDSQPFRDEFMAFSMMVEDWAILRLGDDHVTFHASTDGLDDFAEGEGLEVVEDIKEDDGRNPEEYVNKLTADEKAKVANAGIVIIGRDENVRALMCFGGSAKAGTPYANVCNKYKKEFPDLNIYCMVVPSAGAFYMPEKMHKMSKDQSATIRNIYNHLDSAVRAVDVYTVLGRHAAEDIYLSISFIRTLGFTSIASHNLKNVSSVGFRTPLSIADRCVRPISASPLTTSCESFFLSLKFCITFPTITGSSIWFLLSFLII